MGSCCVQGRKIISGQIFAWKPPSLALMAVRQEANNFESSVVVQELEFVMNLVLYGLL